MLWTWRVHLFGWRRRPKEPRSQNRHEISRNRAEPPAERESAQTAETRARACRLEIPPFVGVRRGRRSSGGSGCERDGEMTPCSLSPAGRAVECCREGATKMERTLRKDEKEEKIIRGEGTCRSRPCVREEGRHCRNDAILSPSLMPHSRAPICTHAGAWI